MGRVYKVVYSPRPDTFVSAVMAFSPLEVKYREGEWVSGIDGTPVLAFDCLRNAKQWMEGFGIRHAFSVWECEAEGVRRVSELAAPHRLAGELIAYWKGFRRAVIRPPVGTVACDRIKLLRRVV